MGLSYDQAPPFTAPLNLFLAAPLFVALAGAAGIALGGDWLGSRWSPAALALTHLLTLGFLGTAMSGSLLQVLPVMLGATVPGAVLVARIALAGLAMGSVTLAWGLLNMQPAALAGAAVILTLGLLPFLASVFAALIRALSMEWIAWPVRQAWLALLLTVALGTALAGGLAGAWPLPDVAALTGLHIAWGLGGWVLILVMGVAYHVVPMLQLTPAYSPTIMRTATWMVFAALCTCSAATLLPEPWSARLFLSAECVGSGAAIWFAVTTLRLQARRRRRIADPTLSFWRMGLYALIAAALLLPARAALPPALEEPASLALGLIFLLGFALPIVMGMLYKIVPFLAWFHLQSQSVAKQVRIPNVKEMIPERDARRQYHLQLAGTLLLVPAPFIPSAYQSAAAAPGLFLLVIGALLLWRSLLRVRSLFVAHGGCL